jgi:hypothetical protein
MNHNVSRKKATQPDQAKSRRFGGVKKTLQSIAGARSDALFVDDKCSGPIPSGVSSVILWGGPRKKTWLLAWMASRRLETILMQAASLESSRADAFAQYAWAAEQSSQSGSHLLFIVPSTEGEAEAWVAALAEFLGPSWHKAGSPCGMDGRPIRPPQVRWNSDH